MPPSHLHREQHLSDVVPKSQLQQAWDRYRKWKPNQVAYDPGMEACRVCVVWATSLCMTNRSTSICLAMTIALLNNLTFNLSQELTTVTEDEKWSCFVDRYTPEPMQMQLNRATHVETQDGLANKIREVEEATMWLMNFISDEMDFRPGMVENEFVSFIYGTYSFLSDVLVHLKYRHAVIAAPNSGYLNAPMQ